MSFWEQPQSSEEEVFIIPESDKEKATLIADLEEKIEEDRLYIQQRKNAIEIYNVEEDGLVEKLKNAPKLYEQHTQQLELLKRTRKKA